MGMPFPPPWESGARCDPCEDVIFSGRTPKFVYAFAQNIVCCTSPDPPFLDPNGVVQMTQQPGFPCWWSGNKVSGIWNYSYDYWIDGVSSHMDIHDWHGMKIFADEILLACKDQFANAWTCGEPDWPGFSGGTVDCFW